MRFNVSRDEINVRPWDRERFKRTEAARVSRTSRRGGHKDPHPQRNLTVLPFSVAPIRFLIIFYANAGVRTVVADAR